MQFPFLCREGPLEEEMATHSSIFAWKTPRAEMPGGLCHPWGCKESDTTERARPRSCPPAGWSIRPSPPLLWHLCPAAAGSASCTFLPLPCYPSTCRLANGWAGQAAVLTSLERVHLSLHHCFVNRNLRSTHS